MNTSHSVQPSDPTDSFGLELRVLAALSAWGAWVFAMIVSLSVLSSGAVARDFEYGGHTRTTGAAAVAIPVLYLAALVLGLVSVTKASHGRTAAFVALLVVGTLSAPVAFFAVSLA
jgi:hypothetical protein